MSPTHTASHHQQLNRTVRHWEKKPSTGLSLPIYKRRGLEQKVTKVLSEADILSLFSQLLRDSDHL